MEKYIKFQHFYEENSRLIFDKFSSGIISLSEAEKEMVLNRWWISTIRRSFDLIRELDINRSPEIRQAFTDTEECLFVLLYRGRSIPFYSDKENGMFYAIIGKTHYCLSDDDDDCFRSIINQIDIQFDSEILGVAN